MRPVLDGWRPRGGLYARCRSEATAAFGSGDLYVEQLVRQARHIEVQVIGDGAGVAHLLERDCSLQRQRQKLVEFAPAPNLDARKCDSSCWTLL
jgi:acetyl/propionyl-CoA carboxylase alpha subunit